MEAAGKEVLTWCAEDLQIEKTKVGLLGSPTRITSVFAPEAKRNCEMLTGSAEEIAGKLAGILKDRGLV